MIRSFVCALTLAGLAALPASANCTLAYVTELPMTLVHHHLEVNIRIGGVTVPVFVDTGSNISMLSRATAAKVDLRVRPDIGSHFSSAHVRGIGGEREGAMMEAPHAHIGDVSAPDMRFIVPDGPREDGADPDLLGMNPLTSFDIDFDMVGHRMVLYQGGQFCKRPPVLMAGPLYVVPMVDVSRDIHTYVNVTMAGRSLLAAVDTGARITTLTTRAARRLGLTDSILAADPRFRGHGVGADTVDEVRHLSAPLAIGDLNVANLRVGIVDASLGQADMLLGMDFLSRAHLWISNSTHSVVFQVPPTASPPMPK